MFGLLRRVIDAAATVVATPVIMMDSAAGHEMKRALKTIAEAPVDIVEEVVEAIEEEVARL